MRRYLLDDDGKVPGICAEVLLQAFAERREGARPVVGALVQAAQQLLELREERVIVIGGHHPTLGSRADTRPERPPPRYAPAVSQAAERTRQPSVPSRASM